MLKTFVIVGEISNLSDARYCAGMGVDVLGFNINPVEETCVAPETLNEISGWVAGVAIHGRYIRSCHSPGNRNPKRL